MKILLAIDDFTSSQIALQALIDQIRADGAEVLIVTVADLLNYFTSEESAEEYFPYLNRIRLSRLANASSLVEKAAVTLRVAGFDVTVGVSEGDPRIRIVEIAEDYGADIIVFGSDGNKDFNCASLGSVSEFLVRDAPCSVAIIRHSERSR